LGGVDPPARGLGHFCDLFEGELARRKVPWELEETTALLGRPARKLRLPALARALVDLPRAAWAEEIASQLDLVLGAARARGFEEAPFEEVAPKLLVRLALLAPEGTSSARGSRTSSSPCCCMPAATS